MSQWTHLAGIIRLDSLGASIVRAYPGGKLNKIKEAVTKALGNTCNFESPEETWDKCDVPMGSEGSLQYNVFPNSDRDNCSLSWGYAVIWGDLRDFGLDDVPKIHEWFQNSIERLKAPGEIKKPEEMSMEERADFLLSSFSIRDAVLSVDVENQPRIILLWETDKVIRINQ
jgi:hypothetical protein